MSESITDLYRSMLIAYHAWSNAARPAEQITDTDHELEDLAEFTRTGLFRKMEWDFYVATRDAYIKAAKQAKEH